MSKLYGNELLKRKRKEIENCYCVQTTLKKTHIHIHTLTHTQMIMMIKGFYCLFYDFEIFQNEIQTNMNVPFLLYLCR